MRVALSIPVEFDGATFHLLVPDKIMARLLPAVMRGLHSVPEELAVALQSGNAGEADASALLGLIGDPELLLVAGEAFDVGCTGWSGVTGAEGDVACDKAGKAAVPLLSKLLIVVMYIVQQQALAQKKETPT